MVFWHLMWGYNSGSVSKEGGLLLHHLRSCPLHSEGEREKQKDSRQILRGTVRVLGQGKLWVWALATIPQLQLCKNSYISMIMKLSESQHGVCVCAWDVCVCVMLTYDNPARGFQVKWKTDSSLPSKFRQCLSSEIGLYIPSPTPCSIQLGSPQQRSVDDTLKLTYTGLFWG